MWRNKATEGAERRELFAREAMTHLDHLYRVALHLAREPDGAQDLVQETFARALSGRHQFASGTRMKAWLTKILHNLFVDRYRETKRWVSAEEKDDAGDPWEKIPAKNPGPQAHLLRKELSEKITAALEQLPEDFRVPIILVDMGDFSYLEAAEILACPVGTVRSRLSRARKRLHQELKDYVGSGDKKK